MRVTGSEPWGGNAVAQTDAVQTSVMTQCPVVGLNGAVQLPAIAHGPVPRLVLGMPVQDASGAKQHTHQINLCAYSTVKCLDVTFS